LYSDTHIKIAAVFGNPESHPHPKGGITMNLCGGNIPSNAVYPRDGHGGNAARHRAEMREIAEKAINDIVPKMAADIYNEAIKRLIGAIQYDIETVVSVAVDSGKEIFNSKKCK
jgi:hypothetical protein